MLCKRDKHYLQRSDFRTWIYRWIHEHLTKEERRLTDNEQKDCQRMPEGDQEESGISECTGRIPMVKQYPTAPRAVYTTYSWENLCADVHAARPEHTLLLPGQVHAAVREVGGGVEVLSAGGQHQVNTSRVADPVLGSSFMCPSSWRTNGRSTAVHHLPRKVDVFQATGAEQAFCKYLGKRQTQSYWYRRGAQFNKMKALKSKRNKYKSKQYLSCDWDCMA